MLNVELEHSITTRFCFFLLRRTAAVQTQSLVLSTQTISTPLMTSTALVRLNTRLCHAQTFLEDDGVSDSHGQSSRPRGFVQWTSPAV